MPDKIVLIIQKNYFLFPHQFLEVPVSILRDYMYNKVDKYFIKILQYYSDNYLTEIFVKNKNSIR